MKTTPNQKNVAAKKIIRDLALSLFVFSATQSYAADLIKDDNSIDLGSAGAYTDSLAVPTSGDTIVFNGTLATNSTFSWTGNRAVQGIKMIDPANDITINLSSAAFSWISTGGTVIDLSSATKNLTLAAASSTAEVRVRGTTAGGATLTVASGRTLAIQSNLFYNNVSNGTTSVIHVTGAGNVTVNGTQGRITDKAVGTGTLTALSQDGTGTVTLSNANTYSGGTSITSGTLFAGASKALGDGAVGVEGGVLDLNGAGTVALTLGDNRDFTMSAGTVRFDLGTSSDQISGAGTGSFNLTGGTIELILGEGFSYGEVYQLFSGFDFGTSIASSVAITGYDTLNYQADLNNLGQLSFNPASIPEPSATALLTGGALLVGAATRRRR